MRKPLLLLFAVLFALLPACGRKGDLIIPGTVLPAAPSGLEAAPAGAAVVLAWTMPDENTAGDPLTDLAGFTVMRAELPEVTDECPCRFEAVGYVDLEFPKEALVEGKRVVWPDRGPGLVLGRRYAYKVVGVNTGGYPGLESAEVKARALDSPAVPEGLTAEAGNRSAALRWAPVEKDASGSPIGDTAGYNLYRTNDPARFPARPVNAQPVMETGYTDSGLTNGVEYFYRLTALRGTEQPYTEGEPSSAVSATPADREPPATPAGLRVVPGEGLVLLSWDPNVEGDLAGYYVYRRGPAEADFKRLTESPTNRITYKDTDVSPGGEYAYAVSAVDDAVPPNESARTEGVTVKTP